MDTWRSCTASPLIAFHVTVRASSRQRLNNPRRSSVPSKLSTLAVPEPVPPVADDWEQLREAFAGWGTNEKLIISILGHRNAAQRKLIRQTTYGEDLLKASDRVLTNDFERLVVLWTLDPAEHDAYLVNEATKRWTSSDQVLMEIACTGSLQQLLMARQAYHARYKKSLEEAVAHHPAGDFRKNQLHVKISEKVYSHEDLIRILATRSKAQVNAMLNHYKNEFGNDINKDLKTGPKDEFLAILRATIKCLTFPEKYFEKVLCLAINRQGTDEGALTRVDATWVEVDMKFISEEYQRRNSAPLHCAIVKDTTGDYEQMLVVLIGHVEA